MLLDIHTHIDRSSEAIFSCTMQDMPLRDSPVYRSVGIHPWKVTEKDWQQQLAWVNTEATQPDVLAIGEAGLDKLCNTPFDLQLRVFREVIACADANNLPLIIHAVKSSNEIIALKKELQPRNPWIIHAFRGKTELTKQYLPQGIYLSYGARYQEEALRATPSNALLLETDESLVPIKELYTRAALLRNQTPEELTQSIQHTIRKIFF